MRANLFNKFDATLLAFILVLLQTLNAEEMPPGSRKPKIGLTSAAMNSLNYSESALVNPLHTFGANLFKSIRDPKKNQMLSPVSVHSALSMLLLGATPNSQTEKELQDVLAYSSTSVAVDKMHESYSKLLAIFKAVTEAGAKVQRQAATSRNNQKSPPVIDSWTMAISKGSSINASYVDQLKKYYDSSARQVSDDKPEGTAQLVNEINQWAKISGFGQRLISDSELSEQFSMLLLSAIRVESSWFESFYEFNNLKDLFYNYGLKSNLAKGATGLSVTDVYGKFAEFTNNDKAEYKVFTDYLKSDHPDLMRGLLDMNFHAAEIGLEGNLSYTIFKPIATVTGNELHQLEEQLLSIDPETKQPMLAKALQALDTKAALHKFEFMRMPAFKFENDIGLKQALVSIGLKRIFDQENAEFSKISTTRQFVSEAKHQAVIEVNKSGLKAAAVTTIKIVPLSLNISMHPIRVIVDNPFMFVIRYNKIPLFIGHVVHV